MESSRDGYYSIIDTNCVELYLVYDGFHHKDPRV